MNAPSTPQKTDKLNIWNGIKVVEQVDMELTTTHQKYIYMQNKSHKKTNGKSAEDLLYNQNCKKDLHMIR